MITRAIGIDATVDPDVRRETLRPGDAIMVCSDGLTTEVEDEDIADLLRAHLTDRADAARAAQALVDAANRAGGHDNTSVVLLAAGGVGETAAQAITAPKPPTAARRVEGNGRGSREAYEEEAPRAPTRRTSRTRNAAPGLPIGPMLAGAALLLSLVGALFVSSPGARRHVARYLLESAGSDPTPSPTPAATPDHGPSADLGVLMYDAPKRFSDVLARGDLLATLHGGGLVCVEGDSGTLVRIGPDGKAEHPPLGSIPTPTAPAVSSASHVFLATDRQGNVYVSSTKKRTIEKRSPGGILLQTIDGLTHPEAVAVDDAGNVYVVDDSLLTLCQAHPPYPSGAKPGVAASPPVTTQNPAKPGPAKPAGKRITPPATSPAAPSPGETGV